MTLTRSSFSYKKGRGKENHVYAVYRTLQNHIVATAKVFASCMPSISFIERPAHSNATPVINFFFFKCFKLGARSEIVISLEMFRGMDQLF